MVMKQWQPIAAATWVEEEEQQRQQQPQQQPQRQPAVQTWQFCVGMLETPGQPRQNTSPNVQLQLQELCPTFCHAQDCID